MKFFRNSISTGIIFTLGISNLVFIWLYVSEVLFKSSSLTTNERRLLSGHFQPETDTLTYFWSSVRELINGDTLYPRDFDVSTVTKALRHTKIIHADVFCHASSHKLLLTLEGGQKAIFKIKMIKNEKNKLNRCHYGYAHPEYEVVGFTLNRMFDLRNMPFVSGRRVSWSNELYPVAAHSLRQSIQKESGAGNRTCLSWKCPILHKMSKFCPDNDEISGVMIYYLEGHDIGIIQSRKSQFHKYQLYGIDDERNLELRPGDKSFCSKFRQEPPYNEDPWFLDIIDISVIDFIMSHDDSRHYYIGNKRRVNGGESINNIPGEVMGRARMTRLDSDNTLNFEWEKRRKETLGNGKTRILEEISDGAEVEGMGAKEEMGHSNRPPLNVIFDYGSAFCDFDHIKILAPLLQCCRIRTRLYNAMVRFQSNFKEAFDEYTSDDPLYPVLLPGLLDDMRQKFEKALASVELCFKLDGKSNVLIDE